MVLVWFRFNTPLPPHMRVCEDGPPQGSSQRAFPRHPVARGKAQVCTVVPGCYPAGRPGASPGAAGTQPAAQTLLAQPDTSYVASQGAAGGCRVWAPRIQQMQPASSPSPGAQAGSREHSDSISSLPARGAKGSQVGQILFKFQLCQ